MDLNEIVCVVEKDKGRVACKKLKATELQY